MKKKLPILPDDIDNVLLFPIPLPGYSALGTANVYLLPSRPVTLVDAGPKFPGAYEWLEEGLRAAGHELSSVERILVTHGHVDHFGLVGLIRKAAGRPVPCFIHAEDRWRITGNNYREDLVSEAAERLMADVDMPRPELARIRERFALFGMLCDPIPDALPLEDGDTFSGESYDLEVLHTPGHTPGSCCLYESRGKLLFSGDNVLKHITPNPLFEIQKDQLRDPGYQSLKAFMGSLDRLARLEVRHVLPGHGEVVEDLPAIVATYRQHHRNRMERIWQALRKEARPAYHLIGDVFDDVPEDDVFLALSEILVHLEILVEEGRAALLDPGPPARYHAL